MSRLDKTIVKFSGAKNYMDQLAQVTGHMNSIDENFYTQQIGIVKTTYLSIIKELNKYVKDSGILSDFITLIETEYKKLNLNVLYHDVVKKAKKNKAERKQHKVRITPKDIYESKWFKMIVELEKTSADLIGQFEIESNKMSDAHKKIIETEPIIINTHTFYGIKINNDNITGSIFVTSKFINKVIEILLTPMYDVKSHMDKNWLPQIDEVLGVELKKKLGDKVKDVPITQEDIKNYVYTFLLTKYRLELTGNTGEFAKTLMKSLDSSVIGSCNPARFINLIDGLKLDEVENNKGVKKVVELARKELIKVSEHQDIKPAELLNDINEILSYGDNEEEEKENEENKKEEQKEVDIFNE
jgi:hypothetical protein